MKNLVILITITLITSCLGCFPKLNINNFSSFTLGLYKDYKKFNECDKFSKNEYKQFLMVADEIDFINYMNDTVFILRSSMTESSSYLTSIWTKKGKIEYTVFMNNISVDSLLHYSEELYPLVDNWDVKTIREKEEITTQINPFSGPREPISAIKAILKNGTLHLDCFVFYEFIDSKYQ